MEEEEHEVYGGEIPDETKLEADLHAADVDMSTTTDDDAVKVSLTVFSAIKSENPNVKVETDCGFFFFCRNWMR